jgi:hypothetical protein
MNNVLNIKIPIYEFLIDEDKFLSSKVPTEFYKKMVSKIWSGYSKYPEMAEFSSMDYNPKIIEELNKEGIIQIEMTKFLYDKKYTSLVTKESLMENILRDQERINLINFFLQKKLKNPFIGIYVKETNGRICELDWLPIPIKKLKQNLLQDDSLRTYNIYHYNNEAYLISFIYENNNYYFEQYHKIGESDLFFNEFETFSNIRINELIEFLPNNKFLAGAVAWDLFYVHRYKYYIGEHPYSSPLDPIVATETDKIRMFLIWLHRLQEYIEKLELLHNVGKTVLLTKDHNEMNGEYVSYNTTYTPEIRQEIISKKEQFKLYTIANDWYILPTQK